VLADVRVAEPQAFGDAGARRPGGPRSVDATHVAAAHTLGDELCGIVVDIEIVAPRRRTASDLQRSGT